MILSGSRFSLKKPRKMERSKKAKQTAYGLLKQYRLSAPTLDELVYITESLGFELMDFSNDEPTESMSALLEELGLRDLAKTSKSFVYQNGEIRLLFVSDAMSAEEKRYAIAHELGHILCGHLKEGAYQSTNVEEEFEANEFAHYLLHPGLGMRIRQQLPEGLKSHTGLLIVLVVVLLAVCIGLGFSYLRMKKSVETASAEETAVTLEMIDPFKVTEGDTVFGADLAANLANYKEGEDYTVSDVYGDGLVHVYTLKTDFEYFGIPEGSTGIRMFTEGDEGITMVCYDFLLESQKTELIVSKLQSIMLTLKQYYGKGYSIGQYYDPQGNEDLINFDGIINGIRNGENGSYSVTWMLEGYAVSLDINFDKNQEVSLGSVRFTAPRKEGKTGATQEDAPAEINPGAPHAIGETDLNGPEYDKGFNDAYIGAGYHPYEQAGMQNYWYDLGYEDGTLKRKEDADGIDFPEGMTFVYDAEKSIFHTKDCPEVPNISVKRRQFLTCSREDAISWGLQPCEACKP